jgi:hypothetical protein
LWRMLKPYVLAIHRHLHAASLACLREQVERDPKPAVVDL